MFYGYNPAYFLTFLSLVLYPFENILIELYGELASGLDPWLSLVAEGLGGSADLSWPHI